MPQIETDDRGRITIPKKTREKFGEKYRIIELKNGIKLIPIPENPIEDLKNIQSKNLNETSIKKLREKAEKKGKEQST